MTATLIGGAALLAVFWFGEVPLTLGAHPFWAQQVIWIGGGVGLVAALLLHRRASVVHLLATAVALIGAYVIATTGKTRFAASYAEDAVAGVMWHYGWIATCALAVLAAALLAGQITARR